MSQTKPIEISKHEVVEAYERVKANKGSAGIDQQSKVFKTLMSINATTSTSYGTGSHQAAICHHLFYG